MPPHIPPYHPASFASQAPKRSRTLEKLPPAQIAVMKPPLLPFHPTPPLLPPPPAYAFASPLSVIESPRHPPRHSISAPHLPLQKPGTPPHGVYHPTAPFKVKALLVLAQHGGSEEVFTLRSHPCTIAMQQNHPLKVRAICDPSQCFRLWDTVFQVPMLFLLHVNFPFGVAQLHFSLTIKNCLRSSTCS